MEFNLSYKEVCKYIDNTLIFGIKPNLLRINKILDLLDNPHKKINFVHIVGTNGKTSVTKITASLLKEHGFKTGYYISPHIYSYTERISLNGSDISEDKFTKIFKEILPAINKVNELNYEGEMTQFEILTAMMFFVAFDEKLDVMVLEAGMGGRWDATNAATAKVVGLTGVSLEHTKILGNSIKAIAKEKAEVIKNNSLTATSSKDMEVLKILKGKVRQTNSRLFVIDKDFKIKDIREDNIKGFTADIKGIYNDYNEIKFPVPGNYQQTNLCLSIALSELFKGGKLNIKTLNQSFYNINITGRFQVLKLEPYFIADASHNPEGIKNLTLNILKYFKNNRKIIIFSVLKDKDYTKMIKEILPIADLIILTSSCNVRSLPVDELEREVMKEIEVKRNDGKKIPEFVYKIDTIKNSIKYSLNIALKNDIICLTGSITNLEFVKSEFF
jgi:dihydrofolate synthase / folylpolyglutamate synthase